MTTKSTAGRIQVRRSTYRGREGFLVVSGGGFFATSIFIRHRETADAIKAILKHLTYSCPLRNDLIDNLIHKDAAMEAR